MEEEKIQIIDIDKLPKPETLSKEEIEGLLPYCDLIEKYVKSVKEFVLSEAVKGQSFKGYKVVEGKSNKTWSDPDKAIKILVEETGIAKTMFFKSPEMISPSQAEDIVTSKLMKEILAKHPDLIFKPAGKPTLVPESDKRPAIGVSKASDDFKDFIKPEGGNV